MNEIITRICKKCGIEKPINEFGKESSKKDGIRPWCKSCAIQAANNWRINNPEKARETDRKAYEKINKEKKREYGKKWYHENIEKIKEKLREYKLKRGDEISRKANERTKKWIAENPEKRAEQQRNRRARKHNNGGTITANEWENLKRKYNYTCLCCGKREPDVKITLDHVIPLILGGSHSIDNAQPLCFSCNSSKQAKHIDYR